MVSPTHRPNSVCFPCNSSARSLRGVSDDGRMTELSALTKGDEKL